MYNINIHVMSYTVVHLLMGVKTYERAEQFSLINQRRNHPPLEEAFFFFPMDLGL